LSNTILFAEAAISNAVSPGSSDDTIRGGLANATAAGNSLAQIAPDACAGFRGPGGLLNTTQLRVQGDWANCKGQRWAEARQGQAGASFVSIVLPPNSPSCWGNNASWLISSSSYHPGGANVVLSDGAVRFISDTINTGNTDAALGRPGWTGQPHAHTGPSTFGVWGALGSRAGGESASLP